MRTDNQKLETIYREAFPAVAKMLHGLGADLVMAKDLFHDAMLVYLEKCRDHSLPADVPARQYLAGISRILWYKQCRQGHLWTELSSTHEKAEESNNEERKAHLLYEYLKSAGGSCMRLLKAFYYDRLSMPAIANKFNYRSVHSATVQKHKCLEKLREKVHQTEIYEEVIA